MRPSSPMRLVKAPFADALDIVESITVYDGTRHVGEARALRNARWEAVDAAGYRLGLYQTRREAERAVWLASRRDAT